MQDLDALGSAEEANVRARLEFANEGQVFRFSIFILKVAQLRVKLSLIGVIDVRVFQNNKHSLFAKTDKKLK